MSQLFENQKYRFPYKDEDDQRLTDIILGEFHGLGREKHKDMVLALWFAELWIPLMNNYVDSMRAEDEVEESEVLAL